MNASSHASFALAAPIEAWKARGTFVPIFNRRLFSLAEGPEDDAAPLVILHGFPSSSFDFHLALAHLAKNRRVILHDYLGFGLSDKPSDYSYSLHEQADNVIALMHHYGVQRAHLLAHDYGTSVATELLARHARGLLPIELKSVTLCNGSVHIALAKLTPSQKVLRLPKIGALFAQVAQPAIFKAQLRRILGHPQAVSEDELDWMWSLMIYNGGRDCLPHLISYLDERTRFQYRWTHGLTAFEGPAHVLWGRRDPIAVPAIPERLAREFPNPRVTWLPELGHYPMLEAPESWAAEALSFLNAIDPRPSN